jgi:hypothetical protein
LAEALQNKRHGGVHMCARPQFSVGWYNFYCYYPQPLGSYGGDAISSALDAEEGAKDFLLVTFSFLAHFGKKYIPQFYDV